MSPRALALAGLGGLLTALSFPQPGLSVLAWFALVPFLLALHDTTPLQAFKLGGIYGILSFCVTLSWLYHPLRVYGHLDPFLAALVTLLLSAYCALYPALFGGVISRMGSAHPGLVLAAAPAVWTALELVRTHALTGFPWMLLGYSQYRVPVLIQFSDMTGVYGVSFLIVLVNTAITGFIMERRSLAPILVALALVGTVTAYGAMRLNRPQTGPQLQASIVQGNIEQDRKWDPAYQQEVFSAYQRLTRTALAGKPDLVLWPETATPFYFEGTEQSDVLYTAELLRFVRDSRTPLLFGSPSYELQQDRTVLLRNAAWLLEPSGEATAYSKLHLVPFGEYVPLKNSLFFFANRMVRSSGDFRSGSDYTIMEVRNGKDGRKVAVGTVICYEIIFPDLVRRFVDKGATVMTTITNDGWFGRTPAPYQHFAMAVFRAVENHVPVVRAANTGVSGFIDAQGSILGTSEIFTEAVLTDTVRSSDGTKTFYTRYGDVFAWLCVLVSVVMVGIQLKISARSSSDRLR